MRQFIDGTRHAVTASSWYAALSLALTIPDIAGWVETPGQRNSQVRYARWFDANVKQAYTAWFPEPHEFLSGDDCYALRCAYLHQGEFDTTAQRAHDVLERFRFVASQERGVSFHKNQRGALLQLEVRDFCLDMADAAERWIPTVTDREAQQRLAGLATIELVTFDNGLLR